jgi:hypothetical protein
MTLCRNWVIAITTGIMLLLGFAGQAAAVPQPQVDAINSLWDRYDLPVAAHDMNRAWVWGNRFPVLYTWTYEPYAGASTADIGSHIELYGQRLITYSDKGRMETSDQTITNAAPWNVTSGLLVEELMTGKLQLGDDDFQQRLPADIPVAGDPDSTVTPTYATLATLRSRAPLLNGAPITQTVAPDGSIAENSSEMDDAVTATDVGSPTQHTIASVFWAYLNSSGPVMVGVDCIGVNDTDCRPVYQNEKLFLNPFYITGYPLTEAYWTKAKVAGTVKDVLLQCFERRCLTYTPDNPDGWKVEFGNVGQHYYAWRYGTRPWE